MRARVLSKNLSFFSCVDHEFTSLQASRGSRRERRVRMGYHRGRVFVAGGRACRVVRHLSNCRASIGSGREGLGRDGKRLDGGVNSTDTMCLGFDDRTMKRGARRGWLAPVATRRNLSRPVAMAVRHSGSGSFFSDGLLAQCHQRFQSGAEEGGRRKLAGRSCAGFPSRCRWRQGGKKKPAEAGKCQPFTEEGGLGGNSG